VDHKTVWMVSGNKGGVGKSLFCLALASAFEMRDEVYAVLDGDGRIGDVHAAFVKKCPSRLADFRELRPDSHTCMLDEKYEMLLHQLLRSSSNLIINTPDGADNILTKWFDVTLSHTEANNYQFNFIYLMSDRPDGLDILPQLAGRFHFLYPIKNLHFGHRRVFSAFDKNYSHKFNLVGDFPALRNHELRLLLDTNSYPYEAISGRAKTINTLSRSRLLKWQKVVNETVYQIIENKEDSNLAPGQWSELSDVRH
jgi:hypothetical protein